MVAFDYRAASRLILVTWPLLPSAAGPVLSIWGGLGTTMDDDEHDHGDDPNRRYLALMARRMPLTLEERDARHDARREAEIAVATHAVVASEYNAVRDAEAWLLDTWLGRDPVYSAIEIVEGLLALVGERRKDDDELRDEGRLLERDGIEQDGVDAIRDRAVAGNDAEPRALITALARTLPGGVVTLRSAAKVSATNRHRARRCLDQLVAARVFDEIPATGKGARKGDVRWRVRGVAEV
ncbi:MAG: hypothetical protein NT062_30030 [Proteobacteria bacterium]|nr:hypothetical protein [Pseudomonadota bacterium]